MDEWSPSALTENEGLCTQLLPVRRKNEGAPSATPAVSRRSSSIGAWTSLCIVGGTLVTGITAVLHYMFNARLENHSVLGYWTQNKSSQVEITLATVFRIVFCFSAGASLCQVSWHAMRRQPLSLADLDALLQEASITTFLRINLAYRVPQVLAITVAILAAPLITVFAPSLSARQGDAIKRNITIPTLDLSTDALIGDVHSSLDRMGSVSTTWDKAALEALLSTDPVGWPMPVGCGLADCAYNFTYSAPAVQCSDLAPDQIDDGLPDSTRFVSRVFQDPPAAYLMAYDSWKGESVTAALNFTSSMGDNGASPLYVWTLAYVPFLASNANPGALINAAGSVCTFYNATYEARTHYVDGAQEVQVSVAEFHEPLNNTYRFSGLNLYAAGGNPNASIVGVPGVSFAPGLGAHVHSLAMADAVTAHLAGSIEWSSHTALLISTDTLISETNMMSPIKPITFDYPITGLNISSSITNISQGLQGLFANATLGFIHLNTAFTSVEVSVPSTDLVYTFAHRRLITTYVLAICVLGLISAAGMFCLFANGQPSSNNFSHLLVATRNPKLDMVANKVMTDPSWSAQARLQFGGVVMPDGGVTAVFGVPSEQVVHSLPRHH
ncbi:hypothetical protein MVEN_02561900 [Mycena venus]|uniref:Uncharacterized protein n=1 Tax=Mycena venus TaxID=2733690 RepID=A0A8H6U361_9AGAR|nr:hypothetical protein MVEN_02561900 [Mycena venus]